MKRLSNIIFIMIIGLFLFTACGKTADDLDLNQEEKQNQSQEVIQQEEKLTVYASFYPMYDFASKIGGDKIDIKNMVPSGTEPHDWEPTASDIAKLEEASVFIYNGAGMEHWVETILSSIENKELIVVETSKGINLIDEDHDHEEEDHSHEEDHDHGEYDPHIWLNPQNAKKQMEAIKDAFIQADSKNKDYYQENFNKYSEELDTLDREFKDSLSGFANRDIIVSHSAFAYLCDAYDLNQIGIRGFSPDSEPDPARMAEIIKFAENHKMKVIFFEELVSPKVAETIAEAIGAETRVLSPIEGLSDEQLQNGDDYFSIMRQNLEALKYALN